MNRSLADMICECLGSMYFLYVYFFNDISDLRAPHAHYQICRFLATLYLPDLIFSSAPVGLSSAGRFAHGIPDTSL